MEEIFTPLTEEQKREMVERIKEHLGLYSHAEFGRKMGISAQSAYAWLQRGSFNAELVAAKCPEISGDWLLTGKGEMLKQDRLPATTDIAAVSSERELKKLTDALVEEQKLTARAQAQADKLIEVMRDLTRRIGTLQQSGE